MKTDIDYTLYLVLDPETCAGRNPLDIVQQAVAGGADIVQLRAPTWKKRKIYELALALKDVLSERTVPLIINDDVDVALACVAEGVHVGQSDLPPEQTRQLLNQVLGDHAILGLSVSFLEEMKAAAKLPTGIIDYIGLGPVFPTQSKADANPAIEIEKIHEYVALSSYPIIGIGGIDSLHASQLSPEGLQGIAVISAICSSPDPETAAREIKRSFLSCCNHNGEK